ncbi:receptor-type guanylate cyclase gcy-12 isoform X2 [Cimex lectularius]|uniref:Guanylate cyclase n=1 Tax=Cimex lectularius TaxID=79782 RepID=A0A8I6RL90_CIMLE|nr:receptor-type guanylate cyclase gcy-12 isoform X2 [Cimex lectularius]
MGAVGVGLGVLLYFLHEGSSSSNHTILLPCHPQQEHCRNEEIRSVLELVVQNKTRTVIGSFPTEHCDLIESATAVSSVTVVAWNCPKISWSTGNSSMLRCLPKLTTIAKALFQTIKYFRFKSATIITLDFGIWTQLSVLLENRLLKGNITVKHRTTLINDRYDINTLQNILMPTGSPARVTCILVPLDWPEINLLLQVLEIYSTTDFLASSLLFVHLWIYPPFGAYTDVLSRMAYTSLVISTRFSIHPFHQMTYGNYFQLDDLDYLVETSLEAIEGGKKEDLVNGFTVWDWVGQNSTSDMSAYWRPIIHLYIEEREKLKLKPLVNSSRDWIRLKTDPFNNTEYICENDECLVENNGFFTKAVNILIVVVSSFILVCSLVSASSFLRRLYQKSRMSKGPCKIILTPTDFVFPHIPEVKRVEEGIEAMLCCWLHQLQELGGPEVDKPDLLKGSVGSLKSTMKKSPSIGSISKISSDPRARYNGDLVQLKAILDDSGSFELRSKSMDCLMTMHTLRHENLNPIIGCLTDPQRPYLVWEYCSRGSLEDVLMADEIKLDWSFRLSLLTDLVRGMKYLHSSPVKVHGNLTSRNCVIDARWVLKITDYAMPKFYECQNLTPPAKKPKDLLWSAPEFLRDPSLRKCGTQAGDVYSFGIIMQEVVVRGEPYCMLSLPPEEILEKIRRPPPLIRPSVSKGAAPPEAINIMRQCWAELPEMRPDFNTIHDLFKTLNHGRKANFVDTMFQMLEKYSNNLEDLIRERTEQLDMEKKKTEQLLNRMLPSYVAEKLKFGMPVDPEEFSEVTIYFSDIVGFTTISAYSTPFEVVDLLNDLYTCFDATINAYNVYKVETIGDAYMVVGGLPIRTPDHAQQVATMALDLLHHSGKFRIRHLPFTPLRLRIGLHTGPCCAGVVGLTMPRYCLFGDTVNTASRMESSGSAWRIHISESTKCKLEESGGYQIECRGLTELKGKGRVMTYWLLGKNGFEKQLPTPPPISLDEHLVQYGRTGVYPNQNFTEEPRRADDSSSDIEPMTSTPTKSKKPVKSFYQLSLDAGLLAASAEEKRAEHKWKSQRQMTFDISEEQKLDNKTNDVKNSTSEHSKSGIITPFSASELNVDTPGVSFINQSKSVQNLNGKLRKVVDENDLSSQYNHYKCLSPNDGSGHQKAASSRFLKRQFSVDKEDVVEAKNVRIYKQNSAGAANDLARIDEVPQVSISSPKFGHSSNYKHRTVHSTASSESLN